MAAELTETRWDGCRISVFHVEGFELGSETRTTAILARFDDFVNLDGVGSLTVGVFLVVLVDQVVSVLFRSIGLDGFLYAETNGCWYAARIPMNTVEEF